MPVYEYQCEACGKESETIQKFSDAPLVDCEACGAKGTLKKLISKSSFALKGSGWYTTDYKKSSKPSEAPKDTAGTAAPTATPSADAKPAGDKAAITHAPAPTSVAATPKKSAE